MQFVMVEPLSFLPFLSVELVFTEMGVLPSWTEGASICDEGGVNGYRVSY